MADSAAAAPTDVKEFTVRVAGGGDSDHRQFIAGFPLGPPGFKDRKRTVWEVTQKKVKGRPRAENGRLQEHPVEWTLEDSSSGATHRGSLEAGMTGAAAGGAACYFVLVKRGPDFVALPVSDFYSFRPVNNRRGGHSLEDAEQAMAARRAATGPQAMPKLAELAAAEPGDEDAMAGGDLRDADDAGEGDSDVEERLRRLTTRGGGSGGGAGADSDKPDAQRRRTARDKGEDWEYEDDRADDDLDMGLLDEDDAPAPKQRPGEEPDEEGPQLSGSDDEATAAAAKAAKAAKAELRRVMRDTGLEASDDDDEDDDDSDSAGMPGQRTGYADDDLDDEDDDEFLENMEREEGGMPSGAAATASQPSQLAAAKQEHPPKAPSTAPGDGKPAGRGKRKQDGDGTERASTKKAKASAEAGAQQGAAATAGVATAASCPPTQREVVGWLKVAGPVAMGELTAKFKRRLQTAAQKKDFAGLVKKVAQLRELQKGSGVRFVTLREGFA